MKNWENSGILSTSQYIALNVGSAVLLLAQLYLVTCGGINQEN